VSERRIRLLRGQVVIREIHDQYSIWTPAPNPRDVRIHRGRVLAKGLPAQVNGHDVPHLFDVGDEVFYHWEKQEKAFTRDWIDGEPACWMYQHEVDAVVELDPVDDAYYCRYCAAGEDHDVGDCDV
jgi:hypothetical protein